MKNILIGVVAIGVLIGSNVITYQVDRHLDYVRDLEEEVIEYQEEIKELNGEKLELLQLEQDGPNL